MSDVEKSCKHCAEDGQCLCIDSSVIRCCGMRNCLHFRAELDEKISRIEAAHRATANSKQVFKEGGR